MKKIDIAILLACLLAVAYQPAEAVDLEFGVGQAHYKHDHSGRWFVNNYPHEFDLKDTAMSAGVSHKFGSLRYRLEYLNLGEVRMSAQFPADPRYTPFSTEAKSEYLIFGRGKVAGGVVSISKDFDVLSVPLYVEVGAFVHRPEWRVSVHNPDTLKHEFDVERKSDLRIGPVFGVGLRHKAIDISIRYLHLEAGGDVPTFYTGAYVGSIRIFF